MKKNMTSHTNFFTKMSGIKASLFVVAFLLGSLIIQPITSVFAEEPATQEATPTETTEPTTEEVVGVTEEVVLEEAPEPEMLTSIMPPDDENEDKKDRIKADISDSNGTLSYSYPIDVPKGRNDVSPQISFNYNSGDKSRDSVIGTGWSINLPSITRVNKKGSDKLYTQDYFTSSLDGELVDQGSGIYTPRTENGNFLKYEYDGISWTITDKKGTIYSLGTTAASRQDDPNDLSRVFAWMIDATVDLNGNTISYTYYKDQGQIYPDVISYNQNGLYTITFNRVVKPVSHTSYKTAFKVVTAEHINNITITSDGLVTSTYDINVINNLVKDITLTGFNGVVAFELPSTDFEYYAENPMGGWQQDNNWFIETNGEYQRCIGSRSNLVDINGDSLLDCVQWGYSNNSTSRAWINTGTTWVLDPTITFPAGACYKNVNSGLYGSLGDVNGDGLLDCIHDTSNASGARVYLANGNGWDLQYSPAWNVPHTNNDPDNWISKIGGFYDINGDGLADAIRNSGESNIHANVVYINTGSGWIEDTNWFYETNGQYQVCRNGVGALVDYNGDGLADCIYWGTTNNYPEQAWINTGTTWVLDPTVSFPNGKCYVNSNLVHYGTHGDVNGDGLVDCIYEGISGGNYSAKFYLGNGNGWDTQHSPSWDIPFNSTDSSNWFSVVGGFYDINGDGLSDAMLNDSSPSGYNRVYLNTGDGFSVMKHITNPEQGESEFTYTHARIQDSSNEVPFPVHIVDSITTNDGQGNIATTNYEYKEGDYYYGGVHDKRFAGFAEVIETDDAGNQTTTKYHQANGEQGNEPTDSYAKIGKVYEQTQEDSSNNLYALSRTNYTENSLGGISDSIQVESELTQQYDGTSGSTDTAISYTYDGYGNITEQIDHGEVSGNINGTFTDIGSDTRTTETSYTYNTGTYLVGLPSQVQTLNNSNNVESKTLYGYDNAGNLTLESKQIETGNTADTTYTYTSLGLAQTKTDPLGNTTTYTYDVNNMYPATITNALNHITSYEYDLSSGEVTLQTDPNGNQVINKYDGLDRLIGTMITVDNGSLQMVKDIAYHTDIYPNYTHTKTYRGAGDYTENYEYVDGFGKDIQTKTSYGNRFITLDTVYNNLGQVEKTSLPYQTTTSSYTNPTTNIDLLTTFVYDPLERVIETTNAKGTTYSNYEGFETTVTDALGNVKGLVTDAFDNLVTVHEHNGAQVYTTSYEYNTQNLLTKVIDAESNVRTINYDQLGRRIYLEDIHDQSDPDYAIWEYAYNDMHLINSGDSNSISTNYTYDPLGRVLTETTSGPYGESYIYVYDICTNGIGRLCNVTTNNTQTQYGYGNQGAVTNEIKTISGIPYTFHNEYNWQSQPTLQKYPNNYEVITSYNNTGAIENISDPNGVIASIEYGVHGKPTLIMHGNGSETSFIYDDSELYEMTNKQSAGINGAIQDLSYTYDNVGNITSIIDSSSTDAAKTQNFTYDDLYRLTQVITTGTANGQDYTRNYTYSPLGNITSFNGNNYSYDEINYANPHAVTDIGGTVHDYDRVGNLISDSTFEHTWDGRNRLVESLGPAGLSTYHYDEQGNRVMLIEQGLTTTYPSPSYEEENGNTKVTLSAGNITLATVKNGSTINHLHTDHLDGTQIITDDTGSITQLYDYYPYGDTRIDQGTNPEEKQYTGYIKDEGTGLHYAGARYYNSPVGRFISQDPVALALGNSEKIKEIAKIEFKKYLGDPQSHNTYAYTRNNPVKYVDENGEWFKEYFSGQQSFGDFQMEIGQAASQLSDDSATWDYAISNPVKAGVATGVVGAAASVTGTAAIAVGAEIGAAGLSAYANAGRIAATTFYGYQTYDILSQTDNYIKTISEVNFSNPLSFGKLALESALLAVPSFIDSIPQSSTTDVLGTIFTGKDLVSTPHSVIESSVNNEKKDSNNSKGSTKK